MKKVLTMLIVFVILSFSLMLTASADHGQPIKGCAPAFELHHMMDHGQHNHPPHRHIGSDTDRNGDGYICVKRLSGDKHLHIDNNVPF